jgi:glycosyltransferase involved in cell wall biosynthesis
MRNNIIRVLFVQRYFRFYRANLFRRLAESPDLELTMIHGTNPPITADVVGLNMGKPSDVPFEVIPARIKCVCIGRQEFYWFSKALEVMRQQHFDVVISDFSLKILSTRAMIQLQHEFKAAFLFWDIGLPLKPNYLTMALRKYYYALSDGIILYNEREKARLMQQCIPAEKLFVAQNTIDIEDIDSAMQGVTSQAREKCISKLGQSVGSVLLHVGRLAYFKRLDILVEAIHRLRMKWPNIRLVLVGDGPERQHLSDQVRSLGLNDNVLFTGAITDKSKLAEWFSISNIVVAPAQIGLLAPETHAYGRPLVISDDLSISGPEAQILQPGVTGESYRSGNLDDLVRIIDKLLCKPKLAEQYGRNGYEQAHAILGIDKQAAGFYQAITLVAARCTKNMYLEGHVPNEVPASDPTQT